MELLPAAWRSVEERNWLTAKNQTLDVFRAATEPVSLLATSLATLSLRVEPNRPLDGSALFVASGNSDVVTFPATMGTEFAESIRQTADCHNCSAASKILRCAAVPVT